MKDRTSCASCSAEVAPRANRPGGYTRIVRDWKNQVGDNAPRAIFELVDRPVEEPAPEGEEAAAADAKGAKKAPKKAAAKPAKAPKGKKAAAGASAE